MDVTSPLLRKIYRVDLFDEAKILDNRRDEPVEAGGKIFGVESDVNECHCPSGRTQRRDHTRGNMETPIIFDFAPEGSSCRR